MEHTNQIAVKILKEEYFDYRNDPACKWHYDTQYKMLVKAIELSNANSHEPPQQPLLVGRINGLLPQDKVVKAFQELKAAINDKGCIGNAQLIGELVWKYFDEFNDPTPPLPNGNKVMEQKISKCIASINGALDGLQLDNTCDVVEKSIVIEQLTDQLNILS